ncbi:MAG: alcohol dehydrogenase catalytic domain-containing protein [Phycisphaerales bacterium]
MRALRFDGSTTRLLRDLPRPVPGPGEALVRPTLVGIASADLELTRPGAAFRGTLGHEFVGVVEQVTLPESASPALVERAKRLKDRRVVGSINIVCGKCDLCRAGLSTHCRVRTVLGCLGRDGCFADALTIPIHNLHPVPEGLDDERAVFAAPLAAAAHVTQMIRVEGKPYITVLGDGRIGLLCAQVMSRLNASVRLLGKHPEKYGLCERWGVKHRHIDEVGRRADQDVVVDCTGASSGLALAMQLVRPRGKIILKSSVLPLPIAPGVAGPAPANSANPAWSTPVNLAPLVTNEIELLGSRCGPIEPALGMLEREEVQVVHLITRRAKLEQGPAALEAARTGNIKVVLEI